MNNTILRNELLKLLKSGKSKRQIDNEINSLFDRYIIPVELREKILSDMQAQYSWLKDKVMGQEERSLMTKELDRYQSQYARAKGKIRADVRFEVSRGLMRDDPSSVIRRRLIDRLDILDYHAETIVRTANIGFAGLDTLHQAQEAGVEYFTYVGPPGERKFCKGHLNKTYHISEIEKMSNGMGLPVLLYCGGYRCRHRWRRATQAEIARYKAERGL